MSNSFEIQCHLISCGASVAIKMVFADGLINTDLNNDKFMSNYIIRLGNLVTLGNLHVRYVIITIDSICYFP